MNKETNLSANSLRVLLRSWQLIGFTPLAWPNRSCDTTLEDAFDAAGFKKSSREEVVQELKGVEFVSDVAQDGSKYSSQRVTEVARAFLTGKDSQFQGQPGNGEGLWFALGRDPKRFKQIMEFSTEEEAEKTYADWELRAAGEYLKEGGMLTRITEPRLRAPTENHKRIIAKYSVVERDREKSHDRWLNRLWDLVKIGAGFILGTLVR